MPPYPDEQLPTITYSIQEFNARARQILMGEGSVVDFLNFALAGRVLSDDGPARVNIDVFKDFVGLAGREDVKINRDYDSIIGITRNLPYRKAISVYPVPNFRECLFKSNHIKRTILLPQWEASRRVDLCSIPNICLCTAGLRLKTLLFFPRMYDPQERRGITTEQMTLLYNQCLRPAAAATYPHFISHWPVSYEAALMAMRDTKGRLHFSRIDLPAHLIDDFIIHLRQLLDAQPMFQDSFFLHEIRGSKGSTNHDPEDLEQTDNALEVAFEDFDVEEMLGDDNEWYIDIGLEIQVATKVLQWRASHHIGILQYALPSATPMAIQRTVNGRHFKKDVSSLLYDLAGFRVEVPSVGAEDYVRYVNVYTTDKSATYQLHPGAFRRHRASDLLPHSMVALVKDIDSTGALYDMCRGLTGIKQEGAARLEVRMKVMPGLIAGKLRDLERELINQWVVGYDALEWWMLRFWRLCAVKYVVKANLDAPPQLRLMPPVLGLAAISIWIKNGLIFRPGDQRWDRDIVANAAFWDSVDEDNLAEEDELEELMAQGNMIPSTEQRGLYFVSAVEETHGIYHLPWARSLDAQNYAVIYNVNSFSDLEVLFMQSENRKTRQDQLAGPRRNRRKRAPLIPRDRSPGRDIAFGLTQAGVRVAPVAQSIPAAVVEEMMAAGAQHDPDDELNTIWQYFLRDIIAVTPMAQRGGGSYCTLDAVARERANEELYKSRELPFRAAILKVADDRTWDVLFFDRFFPEGVEVTRRPKLTQHFGTCQYWPRWQVLMAKVIDRGQQSTIREKLRREFRKLLWLPWSSSDRIWVTGSSEKGSFVKLPPGHEGPAPKIAINGRLGILLSRWSLRVQGENGDQGEQGA